MATFFYKLLRSLFDKYECYAIYPHYQKIVYSVCNNVYEKWAANEIKKQFLATFAAVGFKLESYCRLAFMKGVTLLNGV